MVLLVDDYESNRDLYTEFLRFSRFRVKTACNGQEALERAIELRPDAIVMDLDLPLVDGREATRRLKHHQRTRAIPIIVLTGYTDDGAQESARAAGCDGFLLKPCLSELVDELRRLLPSARRPRVLRSRRARRR